MGIDCEFHDATHSAASLPATVQLAFRCSGGGGSGGGGDGDDSGNDDGAVTAFVLDVSAAVDPPVAAQPGAAARVEGQGGARAEAARELTALLALALGARGGESGGVACRAVGFSWHSDAAKMRCLADALAAATAPTAADFDGGGRDGGGGAGPVALAAAIGAVDDLQQAALAFGKRVKQDMYDGRHDGHGACHGAWLAASSTSATVTTAPRAAAAAAAAAAAGGALGSWERGRMPGLAACCALLLGVRLDKTEQVSDWSVRPLRPGQLAYAAADAAVLVHLANALGLE